MSWKSSDEFGFQTCEGAVTQLFHPPAGVAPADYLRVSLRTDKTFHPWGICMNCSAACEAHRGDPAFCPVCHCRRTALSTDGGFTWANFTDQGAVPDPKSRGGLTRWPERKALVLANCANHHITHHPRTNVTVRISMDDGGQQRDEGSRMVAPPALTRCVRAQVSRGHTASSCLAATGPMERTQAT